MNAASMHRNGTIRKAMNAPSLAPDGSPRNRRMTGFAIAATSSTCLSCSVPKDSPTPAYAA